MHKRLAVLGAISVLGAAFAVPGAADAHTVKRCFKRDGHKVCHVIKHKHKRQSARLRMRLQAVRYAKRHVGAPYVWGATGPRAFDCSGLIVASYRSAGRHLPRTTYSQLRYLNGTRKRHVGDLVFRNRGHVALYIGHGRVIAAPHTGARVRYEPSSRYRYATRSPF